MSLTEMISNWFASFYDDLTRNIDVYRAAFAADPGALALIGLWDEYQHDRDSAKYDVFAAAAAANDCADFVKLVNLYTPTTQAQLLAAFEVIAA